MKFGIGIIGSDDLLFLSPTANANRAPVRRPERIHAGQVDGADRSLVALLKRLSDAPEAPAVGADYEWKSPYRRQIAD